ncbi:MAG TPA: tetratricopeptide repeat protein [Terriglobales bacterium]|nr:tetratricopeptide repeat protein [Terriglobales bacterium]
MRFRVVCAGLLLLFFPLNLSAQRGSAGHGVTSSTSTVTRGSTLPVANSAGPAILVSGAVVVDDGSALPEAAAIQMTCRGRKRTLGYTDSKGSFSIHLNARQQPGASGAPEPADSEASAYDLRDRQGASANWQDCELQAELAGFTSPTVDLASKIGGDVKVDVGKISLHRVAHVQGYTISVTSAAAPGKARKAYEKGLALEASNKWAEAQARFQAAVDAYDKYADAWFELGRVQLRQGSETAARQSFQQAAIADPKFIKPYQELAQIDANEHKWQDLADAAGHLVSLSSEGYPQYWFLSAVAHYNLQDFEVARQQALRGLAADVQHRVPELEHVLGLALIQQHDYKAAEEHIRNYLQRAPEGPNAQLAEQQLAELERVQAQAAPADDSDDDAPDDDQ